MTAAAEEAFAEFVADCGREVYRTPAACVTFLNQYLADFPEERELLLAGLRVGLPTRILQHDGEGFDDYLSHLAERFTKAGNVPAEMGKWTVGAWAFAVGRPIGWSGPEADTAREKAAAKLAGPDQRTVRTGNAIITAFVVAGGFLGGVFGSAVLPLLMLVVEVKLPSDEDGVRPSTAGAIALVILLMATGFGVVSAAAAWVGWWYGRGSEYPWNGFGVAFGTAAGTILVMFFVLPFVLIPFVLFTTVFAATYQTASRGGL